MDYTAAGGATGTAPAMAKWLQMVFQDMPIRLARKSNPSLELWDETPLRVHDSNRTPAQAK